MPWSSSVSAIQRDDRSRPDMIDDHARVSTDGRTAACRVWPKTREAKRSASRRRDWLRQIGHPEPPNVMGVGSAFGPTVTTVEKTRAIVGGHDPESGDAVTRVADLSFEATQKGSSESAAAVRLGDPEVVDPIPDGESDAEDGSAIVQDPGVGPGFRRVWARRSTGNEQVAVDLGDHGFDARQDRRNVLRPPPDARWLRGDGQDGRSLDPPLMVSASTIRSASPSRPPYRPYGSRNPIRCRTRRERGRNCRRSPWSGPCGRSRNGGRG